MGNRRVWGLAAVCAVAVAHPGGEARHPAPTGALLVQDGEALVAALGCGGCHTGVPGPETVHRAAPPLGSDSVPLAPAYIFQYLAEPRTVRPDIAPTRMPTYELGEAERVALALFVTNERDLQGVDQAFQAARARAPEATRETGKTLFDRYACAGCHRHPEAEATRLAPDLAIEGARVQEPWLRAYLADPGTIRPAGPVPGRGGQMPDFRLAPAELDAIVAYLMAQRGAGVPEWSPKALSPFSMQKAGALIRDRWSCLGCHQMGGDGGRIGPGLDGIADRLRPDFVRAMIQDPTHLVPGTVMPGSFEQPDRLDLIASFLLQREGSWGPADPVPALAAPSLGDSTDPGAVLYGRTCAPCHGTAGGGDGFNAPYLPVTPTLHGDAAAMSERPDDTLYDGIFAGGWILGKSHRMPSFGPSLRDEEIRSLVTYIRELCGCEGPAWSRDGRRGR